MPTTLEARNWRWSVERTSGWFNRCRRLSKDSAANPRGREGWGDIAVTHRLTRVGLPGKSTDGDLRRRPPKRPKP